MKRLNMNSIVVYKEDYVDDFLKKHNSSCNIVEFIQEINDYFVWVDS